MSTVSAMLSVKANTRLVLATALHERNAECLALREALSKAQSAPAPVPSAPAAIEKIAYVRKPLPAHFIAAREAAMRTGLTVRV